MNNTSPKLAGLLVAFTVIGGTTTAVALADTDAATASVQTATVSVPLTPPAPPAECLGHCGTDVPGVKLSPEVARHLVTCGDWDAADPYQAVWVTPDTGDLFGDQDGNGLLDGEDCAWK